jgi:hypothetical protein
MTALDALIAAVETGVMPGVGKHGRHLAFVRAWDDAGLSRVFAQDGHIAFHGSLDAAKRLHDALLPVEMCPHIDSILRPIGTMEWRAIIHEQGVRFPAIPLRVAVECGHDVGWNDPARAWLLAILRALEAQGDAE